MAMPPVKAWRIACYDVGGLRVRPASFDCFRGTSLIGGFIGLSPGI